MTTTICIPYMYAIWWKDDDDDEYDDDDNVIVVVEWSVDTTVPIIVLYHVIVTTIDGNVLVECLLCEGVSRRRCWSGKK